MYVQTEKYVTLIKTIFNHAFRHEEKKIGKNEFPDLIDRKKTGQSNGYVMQQKISPNVF